MINSSSIRLLSVRASLVLAASLTVLAGGFSAPAAAQETGPWEVEEIVVTARQRQESLQDFPGAVAVFTQDQIQAFGIAEAGDFLAMTPGVSLVANTAEIGDTQVNIRGINGTRDAEQSYALIIDGILMTNPAALNRQYTNLQQIEVLKGPQGAIYGRNAAAGAIIITTQKPGDTWGGTAELGFAEDNTYTFAGNIGGPISDSLGGVITANLRDTDGFYRNAYYATLAGMDDANVDNLESWDVTGRLVWEVNDKATLDTKIRYGEVDAASIAFNSTFQIPSLVGVLNQFLGFPADVAAYAYENVNNHQFLFNNNIDPFNDQTALEISAKLDYDLGWADLTAWGLFSNIENDLGADGTSAALGFFFPVQQCIDTTASLTGFPLSPPQAIGPTPQTSLFGAYTPTACDGTQYQLRDQKDYSFEVRLASKSNERLRWLAGLYYLNIDREVGVNTGIDNGFGIIEELYTADPRNPTEQLANDDFRTDVYAAFGQLAYDLTDTVEVALALRYDREEREAENKVPLTATTAYIDTCGPDYNGVPGLDPINAGLCATGSIPDRDETWDAWQPKLSLTWDINESLTSYGSIGYGFKSGGFNNAGSQATVNNFINVPLTGIEVTPDGLVEANPDAPFFGQFLPVNIQDTFDKETSWSYELGLKGQWLDNRLRAEAAAYYVDVSDMQFFEFFVGGFGLLRVVENIAAVDIYGVELSTNYIATDWLTLYAGANFISSEIKENASRPDTVGNESPYTPDYTYGVGANVQYPMSRELDFIGSVNVTGVGDTWFHVVQNNERPTIFTLSIPPLGPGQYTPAQRDAYATVNLRAGVGGDNWTLELVLDNALDEDYLAEVIPAPEFGGSFISPGTERRFGIYGTLTF